MALSSRPYTNRYIPSSRFPVGTKWLLIVTCAVSVLYMILANVNAASFLRPLFLDTYNVVHAFTVWQLATHLFVNGLWQLVWNMLSLWMFGAELERTWGTRRFLRFYFACGIVAAATATLTALIRGSAGGILPLGASEAILGILVGYAVMFPDNTLLFGFLIPMKSKYFVMIIAAVVILQSLFSVVFIMAHVSAMLTGFFLLRGKRLYVQSNRLASNSYKDWKLRRAKKKFEVYLRKNDSRRDRTLH